LMPPAAAAYLRSCDGLCTDAAAAGASRVSTRLSRRLLNGRTRHLPLSAGASAHVQRCHCSPPLSASPHALLFYRCCSQPSAPTLPALFVTCALAAALCCWAAACSHHVLMPCRLLLGAPVCEEPEAWARARSCVSGCIYNCYSRKDFVLGTMCAPSYLFCRLRCICICSDIL
jgi:hypothetical protein